jgi:hypothetical protein
VALTVCAATVVVAAVGRRGECRARFWVAL